jgi:hypothetical protein
MRISEAIVLGCGATLGIDLWAVFLRRVFGVQSLDYCLLGRWVLYMPAGKIMHDPITASAPKSHECTVGWTAHYAIGVSFAVLFVGMMSDVWLSRPTLLPALLFGVGTVLIPWFTIQPAFGLGLASARTRNPAAARLKSLTTHTVFGASLYAWALVLNGIFPASA